MKKISIFLIICLLSITGCHPNTDSTGETKIEKEQTETSTNQSYEEDLFAMDTYMTVKAFGENAEPAVKEAINEIKRLDALLSIGESTSEIAILNEKGSLQASEDVAALISRAQFISEETNGAFNPLMLPIMRLWGFCDQNYQVPDDAKIQEQLKLIVPSGLKVNGDQMTLEEGCEIDLGGIAKGFTSSRVMEIFESYAIESGLVNLGGNVHVYGTKTDGSDWRVAIQDPFATDEYAGVLSVCDCAVITSGGYERYFEENGVTYHHIIDPDTGMPAYHGLSSVTIVSQDGTLADALSTALFVMGTENAINFWENATEDFDILLIDDEGIIYLSENLASGFEVLDGREVIILSK